MKGCMIDGRMIGTFPDEGCLRSPSQDKCAAINYECPDGFVTSSISNLTISSHVYHYHLRMQKTLQE